MPELELSAGVIEYEDTGGDGPVIVLLHGLLMDAALWRHVVADLRADYRCVLPTLPLGSHRRPMKDDADLSLLGMVGLVAEFLERLDLHDVTLVGNDWGGPQLLVSIGRDERVGRLVLCSCEAFDNYPPGLPGHMIWYAAKLPGGINAALQPLRLRALRRLPMTLGWMSKRVSDETLDRWFAPALSERAIRRDLEKYASSLPLRGRKPYLLELAERQRSFERPVLVVWGSEDRVMPPEHGRRLAALFPDARLVEIPDSYVMIPEDQPAALTAAIRDFLSGGATGSGATAADQAAGAR